MSIAGYESDFGQSNFYASYLKQFAIIQIRRFKLLLPIFSA